MIVVLRPAARVAPAVDGSSLYGRCHAFRSATLNSVQARQRTRAHIVRAAFGPMGISLQTGDREGTVRAEATSRPRIKRGISLAVRASLLLAVAAAVAVVLLLLGSNRAEAATMGSDRAQAAAAPLPGISPVLGARTAAAGVPTGVGGTLTPVTTALGQTVHPVVPQVKGALTPVRQTLGSVAQQVRRATTPATTPVRQTVDRLVPPATGATAPVRQALAPVVQQVNPMPRALPLPLTRSVWPPAPIRLLGGSAHGLVVSGPAREVQAAAGPGSSGPGGPIGPLDLTGSSTSSAGPASAAVDLHVTGALERALAAELPSRTHDRSQSPASPWPFGAVPTPQGSGGAGSGSAGLSAFLPGRLLAVCFLTFMIGLLLLWSPGRHRPKPEVFPA